MKNISLPDNVKQEAQARLAQINKLQGEFFNYVSGVKDGMGLVGDFNFDTATWQFRPVPKEKK